MEIIILLLGLSAITSLRYLIYRYMLKIVDTLNKIVISQNFNSEISKDI